MSARAQHLLLGDWGPIVRDPIDLIRGTFVVGAVVLLLIGSGEWLRMAGTAALVVFARFVDLPRPFDLGLCIGLGLQAWGKALGLYQGAAWYDVAVHFGLPLLVAPLAYIALARLHVVPDLQEEVERHHYAGIVIVTFSVMTAFGGVLWEVYEYVADMLTGSNLSKGLADTIEDVTATAGGSAIGGFLLTAWAERGWGSRRLPADRVLQRLSSEPARGD